MKLGDIRFVLRDSKINSQGTVSAVVGARFVLEGVSPLFVVHDGHIGEPKDQDFTDDRTYEERSLNHTVLYFLAFEKAVGCSDLRQATGLESEDK